MQDAQLIEASARPASRMEMMEAKEGDGDGDGVECDVVDGLAGLSNSPPPLW